MKFQHSRSEVESGSSHISPQLTFFLPLLSDTSSPCHPCPRWHARDSDLYRLRMRSTPLVSSFHAQNMFSHLFLRLVACSRFSFMVLLSFLFYFRFFFVFDFRLFFPFLEAELSAALVTAEQARLRHLTWEGHKLHKKHQPPQMFAGSSTRSLKATCVLR